MRGDRSAVSCGMPKGFPRRSKLRDAIPPAQRESVAASVGCSVLHLNRVISGHSRASSRLAVAIVVALDGAVTIWDVLGVSAPVGQKSDGFDPNEVARIG